MASALPALQTEDTIESLIAGINVAMQKFKRGFRTQVEGAKEFGDYILRVRAFLCCTDGEAYAWIREHTEVKVGDTTMGNWKRLAENWGWLEAEIDLENDTIQSLLDKCRKGRRRRKTDVLDERETPFKIVRNQVEEEPTPMDELEIADDVEDTDEFAEAIDNFAEELDQAQKKPRGKSQVEAPQESPEPQEELQEEPVFDISGAFHSVITLLYGVMYQIPKTPNLNKEDLLLQIEDVQEQLADITKMLE